jgi:hypothetical protein
MSEDDAGVPFEVAVLAGVAVAELVPLEHATTPVRSSTAAAAAPALARRVRLTKGGRRALVILLNGRCIILISLP